MKTINNFSQLREYGIDLLTGESCALSRRLLCDLTERGRRLVCQALGVPDISLPSDWNGHGAVGSILLDRETLNTLCILALFEDPNTLEVWELDGSFTALDKEDKELYREIEGQFPYRKYYLPKRGRGLRNEHIMSGRVE